MEKEIIKSITNFSMPDRYSYKDGKKWEEDVIKLLEEEKLPLSLENSRMQGYKIVTSKQNIFILIDAEQCCCENWGYEACSSKGIITSNDDFNDFVGAELIDVAIISPENHKEIKIYSELLDISYNHEEDNAEFVNLNTTNGLLQFAVYNSHNGYYGHDIYIKFNNTEIEDVL